MQNFKLVANTINTKFILGELDAQEQMWLANTSRQKNVYCQRHTRNIFLRVAKKPLPRGEKNANNVQESVTASAAVNFPYTLEFCENLANTIHGKLGRVMLVALAPNSQVYPHVDHGKYYRIRDRYHLVITSPTGSPLSAGTETAVMREGELWVFNNKIEHSAINTSNQHRIHLIFDILPELGRGIFARSQ